MALMLTRSLDSLLYWTLCPIGYDMHHVCFSLATMLADVNMLTLLGRLYAQALRFMVRVDFCIAVKVVSDLSF